MTPRSKALIWAAIIIATAFFTSGMGLSSGAAMGITFGLTGAAWGSISSSRRTCARGCS